MRLDTQLVAMVQQKFGRAIGCMRVWKYRHHGHGVARVCNSTNLTLRYLPGHVPRITNDAHTRRADGVQADIKTSVAQHTSI